LAGGGNKVRKLEYLLADAQQHEADTLITVGGLQSNHARQTAAVAAKFGYRCELVLEDVAGTPKSDYYHNGNEIKGVRSKLNARPNKSPQPSHSKAH
jgi:D-cysteine desulfhydrase/L-cysteate sulfo-lyase